MNRFKIIIIILLFINFTNTLFAENDFFEKGKKSYIEKKYKESKFLFQRNIVFNPKDPRSYLYLAKIYNFEKNQKEEEKNINTTLLLDPANEEALLMLMKIEIEKSNYIKVKKLTDKFSKVCENLCEEKSSILDALKNIEPKNDT